MPVPVTVPVTVTVTAAIPPPQIESNLKAIFCCQMGLGPSIFALLAQMPLGADPIAVTNTADPSAEATAGGKAPRKALAKKAARVAKGPARPYKKVEADALKLRVDTMKKKIGLLESKAVILRDRLEMHELEVQYRSEEGASKAV